MTRALDVVMAVLFAVSAVLQFNDPDPWPWFLIYAGAAVVCALTVARKSRGRLAPLLVGIVAFAWAVWILFHLSGGIAWSQLAASMHADSPQIEESRETLGLFIVAAWMTFIAVRRWRVGRRPAR